MEDNEKLKSVIKQIEEISALQTVLNDQVRIVKQEINKLNETEQSENIETHSKGEEIQSEEIINISAEEENYTPPKFTPKPKRFDFKNNFEKFIGENLINKIGIIITIIGIAIGTKYSIEHNLINPVIRVIMGYCSGIILFTVGWRLKEKYKNYSAVLVSGASAVMYSVTFFAYDYYEMIPQIPAFILMVLFTVLTVLAAIRYNLQVIAHIGLVGAYLVPILLSDGSGRVLILFSYVTIINIGIIYISFRRYWKPLQYSSFLLTWFIFISWYSEQILSVKEYFAIAFVFLIIFYLTFYTIFLIHKLHRKEKFENSDIILNMLNSAVFYFLGFLILDNEFDDRFLGVFTLIVSAFNFSIAAAVIKIKEVDKNVFYFIMGLGISFLTITIPVEFDGMWVSLLLSIETLVLFWIGRTKHISFYERLALLLVFLTFLSIINDWDYLQKNVNDFINVDFTAVFNMNFLVSVLIVISLLLTVIVNLRYKASAIRIMITQISEKVFHIIPIIFIIVLYNVLRLEITYYWLYQHFLYPNSLVSSDLSNIWVINYTLIYVTLLTAVWMKKYENNLSLTINMAVNSFVIFIFLVFGLRDLSQLRIILEYSSYSEINLFIRYISYVLVAGLIYITYRAKNGTYKDRIFDISFDYIFHISLLWILSSELMNIMEVFEVDNSYKLGLSILWGVYSLALLIIGIKQEKKYLRLTALSLFSITLLKLFFYDIAHLKTIPKTIIFISLGTLLLIMSFLYNKFKDRIGNSAEKEN